MEKGYLKVVFFREYFLIFLHSEKYPLTKFEVYKIPPQRFSKILKFFEKKGVFLGREELGYLPKKVPISNLTESENIAISDLFEINELRPLVEEYGERI